MSTRRLSLSLGWSALLMLSAQTARSESMPYQCFDRTTRRPVAASLVDLSTAEVSCEPTTLLQPKNTSLRTWDNSIPGTSRDRIRDQQRTKPLRRCHGRSGRRKCDCAQQPFSRTTLHESGPWCCNAKEWRFEGLPPRNLYVCQCLQQSLFDSCRTSWI